MRPDQKLAKMHSPDSKTLKFKNMIKLAFVEVAGETGKDDLCAIFAMVNANIENIEIISERCDEKGDAFAIVFT